MKTSESLLALYEIFNDLEGPQEAREFVANSVWLILSDIQDQNLPITAEEIEKRLFSKALEYKSVAEAKKKSIA